MEKKQPTSVHNKKATFTKSPILEEFLSDDKTPYTIEEGLVVVRPPADISLDDAHKWFYDLGTRYTQWRQTFDKN